MRAATSSMFETSSARFMRRSLPSMLMSSGMREPFGFSNSKRRAAGARHAIGDLRDLEDRIDFRGDALQFAFFFQPGNEFAQIPVRQNILPRSPAATAGGLQQTQRDTLA